VKVEHPRCAGIDIHKETMTVCVFIDRQDGSAPELHKRKLSTHSQGIEQLKALLKEHEVTDVGMESTGVYWKPVWNALEGIWRLHLCNPQHVRVIPGSKTDMRDGTRIAELLAYGKLPESYIPPRWQRELRDLTRLRARISQEVSRIGNRILKVLEDAQIKLDCVASDALGVSGRLILDALVDGQTDPDELVKLAKGKLKKKKAQLRQALDGKFNEHHRFQIRLLMKALEECEDHLVEVDTRIEPYLMPYADQVERLDAIPGVDRLGAAIILAEIGPDMSPWESDEKLANWSCLSPGNWQSGGKRLSSRTRKGNRWLRRAFCQMAWAATRKNGSYFKAQFRRIAGHRGKQRALLAVAHSILIVVYHLLKTDKLEYRELGEDFFDQRNKEESTRQHVKRLKKLGWEVELKPKVVEART